MIIVTGHLTVSEQDRERHLSLSHGAVSAAREAPGCLDFAVSPDLLEPTRVNILERWASREALERFRANGPSDEFASLIQSAEVDELEVLGDRGVDGVADLVWARVAAIDARDLDALAATLAPNIQSFNVLPPARVVGRDSVLASARAWFAGYASPIGYAVHNLTVVASGDLGIASYRYRVSGTLTSGDEVDMWVRATLGCELQDGRWLVVHDHESVPWDPETGQGILTR